MERRERGTRHDQLYQLIGLGLLSRKHRKRADQIFREIELEDGVRPWIARLDYWALRAVWTIKDFGRE